MNMKIASAIALAMGIAVAGSASAASDNSGTVNFTGSLSSNTCVVSGGQNTDQSPTNFTVQLDETPTSSLTANGQQAGWTPWSVVITGAGTTGPCKNGAVASMSFNTADNHIDGQTGALVNTLTGQATNVEIQVTKADKTALDLRTPGVAGTGTLAAGQTTIPFGAQYYATGATTAGEVRSALVYAVNYN